MKYIDAEKLIAEIERRINAFAGDSLSLECSTVIDGFESVLEIISHLQQEQPEQKKNCAECPHCVDRKDQFGWHFKGCFGGPYKGKFIAEIDKCPLEMEQEEKKLPEGLEEAAIAYSEQVSDGHNYRDLRVGFIAGAEWDRAKMLEGAGEMVCFVDWYDGPYLNFTTEQMFDAIERAGAKEGDTVRVIIVKEDK